MRKVVFNNYGDADILKIEEVPIPYPKKNEVLVKVMYSSLNAVDWKYRRGYFSFFTNMLNTKLGFDVVGEIVEVSKGTSMYKIGDFVLGLLPTLVGGAHSEYVILKDNQFVLIPSQINLKEFAGLPMAGVTAWSSLVEKANIKYGQKILINGGSSGVGHIAIQLAKMYGAEVTSISSSKNETFCKSIGADYTIDYQKVNMSKLDGRYDIIFDVVSNLSINLIKSNLNVGGTYIDTNISFTLISDMIFNRNVKFVYVHPHIRALTELCNLIKSNLLKIHVDRTFKLDEIVEAHKYVEKSKTVGKVILEIN